MEREDKIKALQLDYVDRIRYYMYANKLNVAQLARLCDIPYQATNNVITLKSKPSLNIIVAIYETTGINFIESKG